MFSVREICKLSIRLLLKRKQWVFDSFGYCESCNKTSAFLFSVYARKALDEFIKGWDSSETFKKSLLDRENYFCNNCLANFRVRSHARTVLKVLGFSNATDMLKKIEHDETFSVYETAAYNVFRVDSLQKYSNYVVSEFFENHVFGETVNGIRNESLEGLTFPDNSFDVVINSDVLEHVVDLNKSLSEIKRVLKPGGYHVFTIPVDFQLEKTAERALVVDGKIKHLKEPVMHGDTIRGDGILAFRDFGQDVLAYFSRDGFKCCEVKYQVNDRLITSVYYAQKEIC